MIKEVNSFINGIVWGWPMLFFLVGCGIYLTFELKFLQVREFAYTMKNTLFKVFKKDSSAKEGELTAFQAVSTALAATVGTGNIAGVALAIATGGPGAVFWMWLSAIFGMCTKFSEVVLAVTYRERNSKGEYIGGPMYYIKNGLKLNWLAYMFAFFGAFASFGIGNMTQSNAISQTLNTNFNIDQKITGVILILMTGIVVIGGVKRIGQVTEKIVPFMSLFYILGGLIILVINAGKIPGAFALIFSSAFNPKAAFGGAVGVSLKLTMKMGIARGVFTNEAGLGSAPIAHAASNTDHPVRQGLWGIFEVFTDTIVVCSITALTILTSGLWNSGLEGADLTVAAFDSAFSGGRYIVAIGLLFFAFSTVLGWAYYGEKCFSFLVGEKIGSFYKYLYVLACYVGATGSLQLVWNISDTLNGLMAIPNLIGLAMLSKIVIIMTKDFFKNPDYIRQSPDEYLSALPEKFKF
ncbi:alanine/glycine:cation symporter family protein [Peptoniphilus raoultii]|uniref:alanine/glycine:cation symporter family protein n=1 Tax=Peptoniphilus raoultii TaxID=1776387 RepID=UPI0008DAD5AA|nr:sodium:alanine symporter family protein [Peptoniphilus raoultii]